MKTWLWLLLAIIFEVIATSLLKASDGFRLWKLAFTALLLYAISFYLLSLALTIIPLGIAYSIWSGLGVFAITFIGIVLYQDKISTGGYIGIFFIAIGVITSSLSIHK